MKKKLSQIVSAIIIIIVAFFVKENNISNSDLLENLYKSKASGELITFEAVVENILSDDNEGSRHQRLILRSNNRTVLLAHNIDVAPRVPVKKNDTVIVKGEYEWNQKGGVVHWTHKKNNTPYGWVQLNNKKYQ